MFFSFVVTPSIFVKLDSNNARLLIRAIFPWYYLLIIATFGFSALCLYSIQKTYFILMVFVFLKVFITRQFLMPKINSYRDNVQNSNDIGNQTGVKRLHRIAILINFPQLLVSFVVITRYNIT